MNELGNSEDPKNYALVHMDSLNVSAITSKLLLSGSRFLFCF